jgi:hypothetical protein
MEEERIYRVDVVVRGTLGVLARSEEEARALVDAKDPQTLGIVFETFLDSVDEVTITEIRKEDG